MKRDRGQLKQYKLDCCICSPSLGSLFTSLCINKSKNNKTHYCLYLVKQSFKGNHSMSVHIFSCAFLSCNINVTLLCLLAK